MIIWSLIIMILIKDLQVCASLVSIQQIYVQESTPIQQFINLDKELNTSELISGIPKKKRILQNQVPYVLIYPNQKCVANNFQLALYEDINYTDTSCEIKCIQYGDRCKVFSIWKTDANDKCRLYPQGCANYNYDPYHDTYSSPSNKVFPSNSKSVCTHKNVFNADKAIRDTCSQITAQESCYSNVNCQFNTFIRYIPGKKCDDTSYQIQAFSVNNIYSGQDCHQACLLQKNSCKQFQINNKNGRCWLFKAGCQLIDNLNFDFYTASPSNCEFTQTGVSLSVTKLDYLDSVDTSQMLDLDDLQNTWTSAVTGCSFTCVIKEKECINSYQGTLLKIVGNTILGIQNQQFGWTEQVCTKCTSNDDTIFQIDDIQFSQASRNCEFTATPISSSITELKQSDQVGTSQMKDLSLEWTSWLSSCSYTCVLKAAGCTGPYTGSLLSIVKNKINGAQNEVKGWNEEVCAQCTDSKGAVFQKDNMIFSQIAQSKCVDSLSLKQRTTNDVIYEDSQKIANAKIDFFENSEQVICPISKCILKNSDCEGPNQERDLIISETDFTISINNGQSNEKMIRMCLECQNGYQKIQIAEIQLIQYAIVDFQRKVFYQTANQTYRYNMKKKYSKISIQPEQEIFLIDYFQNEDEMTIMFTKAGINVEEIIYKDLQGKETRVESIFTITVANQSTNQSDILNYYKLNLTQAPNITVQAKTSNKTIEKLNKTQFVTNEILFVSQEDLDEDIKIEQLKPLRPDNEGDLATLEQMKLIGEYFKNLIYKLFNQQKENEKIKKLPVILQLDKITMDGQIKINFNQKLIIQEQIKSSLRLLSENSKNSFIEASQIDVVKYIADVYLQINSNVNVEDLSYFISVIEWTEDFLLLQINFTQPLAVSQGNKKDEIIIRIKESAKVYFTSATSLESLVDSNLKMKGILQRQLIKGLKEQVIKFSIQSSTNAISALVFVQLISQIGLKSSMSLMVSLFLILQYLAYFDQFNIKYPATVYETLINLRSIVEFDMLKLDKLIEFINQHSSEAQEPTPSQAEEQIMPKFVKISILVAVLIVVAFVILKIIVIYKNQLTEKISKFIKDKIEKLFFNDLIQSLSISYLSQCLYASNLVKSKSYSAGIILTLVLILIPIALGRFLLINFKDLDQKSMRTKFEKLYTNIVVSNGIKLKVLYFPIFLLKRFIHVLIPLLFINNTTFQIIALNHVCLMNTIVYGAIRSHGSSNQNRLELANEFMISTLAVLNVTFTPFCQNYEASFNIGYYFICVLLFIFVYNFGFIVNALISKLKRFKQIKKQSADKKKQILRLIEEQKIKEKQKENLRKQKLREEILNKEKLRDFETEIQKIGKEMALKKKIDLRIKQSLKSRKVVNELTKKLSFINEQEENSLTSEDSKSDEEMSQSSFENDCNQYLQLRKEDLALLYLPLKKREQYTENEITSILNSSISESSETSNFSDYLEHRKNLRKVDDVQIVTDFRKESYEKEIGILENINQICTRHFIESFLIIVVQVFEFKKFIKILGQYHNKDDEMVAILESAIEIENQENLQTQNKIMNLKKLEIITQKHFKRNKHVTIRDAEDCLRMLYHMFEKMAKIISSKENYGNYSTLLLKQMVTPQRLRMSQIVQCENSHVSFTKFIYQYFICLYPRESLYQALKDYFGQLFIKMECSQCQTHTESTVSISRMIQSIPRLLVVKVLRISDKGKINIQKMKLEAFVNLKCNDTKQSIIYEQEYELFAFNEITGGSTLNTCFYRTFIKLNENEWLVKGPVTQYKIRSKLALSIFCPYMLFFRKTKQPDDIDLQMDEAELEEHFIDINDQPNTLYDFQENIYCESQTVSKKYENQEDVIIMSLQYQEEQEILKYAEAVVEKDQKFIITNMQNQVEESKQDSENQENVSYAGQFVCLDDKEPAQLVECKPRVQTINKIKGELWPDLISKNEENQTQIVKQNKQHYTNNFLFEQQYNEKPVQWTDKIYEELMIGLESSDIVKLVNQFTKVENTPALIKYNQDFEQFWEEQEAIVNMKQKKENDKIEAHLQQWRLEFEE